MESTEQKQHSFDMLVEIELCSMNAFSSNDDEMTKSTSYVVNACQCKEAFTISIKDIRWTKLAHNVDCEWSNEGDFERFK